MTNEELQVTVLQTLKLIEVSKDRQESALNSVETIARKRMALAIPDLLTDEQVEHVELLREKGTSEEEILHYVESLLPATYDELLEATMLDVAEQVVGIQQRP